MEENASQRVTRSMPSTLKTEPLTSSNDEIRNIETLTSRSMTSNNQLVKRLDLNYDYNILLKLMNKRKLHLPCPLCKALVVNLTDHLTKTHFVKNINERRNLIDSVRNEFILSEEGVFKLLEFNKTLKSVILLKRDEITADDEEKANDSIRDNLRLEENDLNRMNDDENLNSNSSFNLEDSENNRPFKKRKLSKPIKKPYLETDDSNDQNNDQVFEFSDTDETKVELLEHFNSIENRLNQTSLALKTLSTFVNEKINDMNNQLKATTNDLNFLKSKLFKK